MSDMLTPQTVDSGWFLRWCRQGWNLWLRAPGLLLLVGLIPPLMMIGLPSVDMVMVLVIVPFSSVVFVVLRLLDQHGHVYHIREMLRGNLKDIVLLTKDLFIWIAIMTAFVTAVRWSHKKQITMHLTSHHLMAQALAHGGFWETHAFAGVGAWLQLFCEPMAAPLIFLTLLVGHQLTMHLHVAYMGMIKNWRVASLFVVFCFFGNKLLSLLDLWIKPLLSTNDALILSTGTASAALIFFSTLAYLWCREMFEGQKENVVQKSSAAQNALESSHQMAS